MKKSYLLPLLGLALASQATAATVLLWDGSTLNYVTANQIIAGANASAQTTNSASVAYDTSTPLTIPAGYVGPSLYGGIFSSAEHSSAVNRVPSAVIRNDSPESIRFQSPLASTDTSLTLNAAVLFSTNSVGTNLSFADIGSLSAQAKLGIGNTIGLEVRWLAVGKNVTYVSSDTVSVITGVYNTFELTNASATNWAAWTPGSDLSLGTLTYDVAGSTISDITRVGYYLGVSKTDASSATTLDVTTFALTTVPEPSTYAMYAGLLVLGFGLIRRSQKK